MSDADRNKWETRYREGAYSALSHPSVCLVHALSVISADNSLPVCKAIDLACGAGRNALFLAQQQTHQELAQRFYQIDAVDISAEALERGRTNAQSAGLKGIHWYQLDLDDGLPADLNDYGLLIMIRYLDIALLRTAAGRLQSGGYLLAEVHLQSDQDVAGPSGSDFRAAPGALKAAAKNLEILEYFEGVTEDPDGRRVALARMFAKKL